MKIEKERNCVRITYDTNSAPGKLAAEYEQLCSRTEGIYLPSDIQKAKDGIVINIRHRETLKNYLEKNVFKIDDYVSMMKAVKKICVGIFDCGYDPSACIWDSDAVFVGGSTSDLEVVYLLASEEVNDSQNSLADFFAVVSLHVFDSRDDAIDALSDAVRMLAESEKENPGEGIDPGALDKAVNVLLPYSSSSGLFSRYAAMALGAAKKYFSGFFEEDKARVSGKKKSDRGGPKETKRLGGSELLADVQVETSSNKTAEHVTEPHPEPMASFLSSSLPKKENSNGRRGVQSRQVEPERVSNRVLKEIEIGRSYFNNLKDATSLYISRNHAVVLCDGRKYILKDSGSLNGTYLNGEKLDPDSYYRLIKGDVISLAHRELSFAFSP